MKTSLNAGWKIQSSDRVAASGEALSREGFSTAGWYQTTLPATVLGTLVGAGVYADPFVGLRLSELPGQGPAAQNFSNFPMPEGSPFAVPWWFRKEFALDCQAGPTLRLKLDGINYRANVWLNGQMIGDGRAIQGTYCVHELDVTRALRRQGTNALALQVYPPTPADLGNTWVDWNPSPPDKNMGLWRDAWLVESGPVSLSDPQVISRLSPGGAAELVIAGDLTNWSAAALLAEVRAMLEDRLLSARVELSPGERRRFEIQTRLDAPRLWWPRALGEPALYPLELTVHVGEECSDAARLDFGVREVTCAITEKGHALFSVNGRPMLIRGAGWAPDLFLRRSEERERAQLEYVKDMGLNTLRFEGMLEREEFLDWCDRDGILVIGGWCCSDLWEKWSTWTEENREIALRSLSSQIRRIRRHPCLIAWWYGSDFPPPEDVERAYLGILTEEHWPNPAHSSASHRPAELTGPSGLKMQGPYDYVPPGYWLQDQKRGGAFGFATEVCPGPAIPPLGSLRKMLTDEHLWPIGEAWNLHAGGQEFHHVRLFSEALSARFGAVEGVAEFAALAQLMAYEGQRAMFEAYARNKWKSTGVIQWMLNNAWPSLIWHLYDYYLRPGGGFFGAKKACEPLHVQYSPDDRSVVVHNDRPSDFAGLKVEIRLFDLRLAELMTQTCLVNVKAQGKTKVLTVPAGLAQAALTFLDLRLFGPGPRCVSQNFYWLPAKDDVLDHHRATWIQTPVRSHADLRALRSLPTVELAALVSPEWEAAGRDRPGSLSVTLVNPADQLAFFVELRLTDAAGEDVLPVLYSDNYLCLLPGESRGVQISLLPWTKAPAELALSIHGLNVPERKLICKAPPGGAS